MINNKAFRVVMLNDQTSGARLFLLIITKLQQTAPAAYRKIANNAKDT